MPEEQRLEEQILSQEAQRRLSQQLDEVEKINVNVQTDLLKIIQGQANGVSVAGRGLVMRNIRIQELKLQTDGISINPFSALFGEIELNHPINATARIVLTEADINRALASNDFRSTVQNFDLDVDGEIVSFQPQEIQINLPGNGKIEFTGKILLHEGNTRQLGFTAVVRPRTLSQPIMMETFICNQGDGISLEIIAVLMQKLKELVNLPYFEFEDMVLRIKSMEVHKGRLILLVEAYVKQIPISESNF
ncbi:hypothetical protein BZZ01_12185 [Nostocales cyanobacterium HT-58-2]|nr:hypothetical protein BZZ01_12185 [Nostocales cyanobacterium HT-58-2]